MPDFKPPEYVSSLIQAVNDGAKTAQTGALAVAALGFYLMAVSFSTSDLDLLLDHTTSIAQLGLQIQPQAVFGVAPVVFLALHAFTLVRYDMLSANLRFLRVELSALPPEDQERCRQLLANVEFIMGALAPKTSELYSWLFRWVWVGLVAIFPVLVFLVVQIFSMRYQSPAIIWAQRGALTGNFIMLIWFFWRQDPQRRAADGLHEINLKNLHRFVWRSKNLWWLPLTILTLSIVWIRVPGENADLIYWRGYWREHPVLTALQPFDRFFCPEFFWGCRVLDGSDQTLVAQFFPEALMKINQATRREPGEEGLVAGVVLSGRNLRGAVLADADLTNANLTGAFLNHAYFESAFLNGASLFEVEANWASFRNADLTDANFGEAQLEDSSFNGAKLENSYFFLATLSGADFRGAKLDGADFEDATFDDKTSFVGATYTTYDSKDQCKTLFSKDFDPLGQGLKKDDDGEPAAPNPACPDNPDNPDFVSP